jgi:MYXO-CTERM domain-containing protein
MDMISGACPDCSILLVELGTLSDTDIQTGVTTAITLGATATSISLGGPETQGGGDPTGSYTTAGHLVLAASGDFAYDLDNEQGGGSGASYPASAPDILAVGGTELFLKSGAVGTGTYGEGVWNDGNFGTSSTDQDVTTSGCSQEFTMPTWQATPTASACGTYRATADLSAAATYYGGGKETDIAVYCTAFETAGYTAWLPVEGTSASSPLVAALLTRVGMAVPISNSIATLYASSTVAAFNDVGNATTYPIPSGGSDTDSNASCTPTSLCTVGTGWDGPSGVGTPNGTKLAALGASSGSSSGSSSGGSNDDAGSEDAGGSSSGSSSGGGSGSGSGSSSGGSSSGTSSGSPISEDSGTPAGSGSGGSSNDGGNGFEPGGGSSSGCNTTSGSSPMEGTGMIALLVGGMALLGSRRRGAKK